MNRINLIDTIRSRLNALRADGEPVQKKLDRPMIESVSNQLGTEWSMVDEYVHQRVVVQKAGFSANPKLVAKSIKFGQYGFFDTETTGLSSGAGTIIFLFGLGSIKDDQYIVRQIFLENFSGEKSFLENVERLISNFSVLISFNGLAFDKRILDTRLIIDGRAPSTHQHIDLLDISRKIWGTLLPDCRLKTLERDVLKINRGKDIDGSEVPDIYFQFQFSGHLGHLIDVFDHNLWDVVTLAQLLGRIESVLEGERLGPYDHFGVGKILQNRNDGRSSEFFLDGFTQGDRRCGVELARCYKRTGLLEKAVSIWRDLVEEHCDLDSSVELAKYFEHVIHDYARAVVYIEPFRNSLNNIDPKVAENLKKRFERLKIKIESAGNL